MPSIPKVFVMSGKSFTYVEYCRLMQKLGFESPVDILVALRYNPNEDVLKLCALYLELTESFDLI